MLAYDSGLELGGVETVTVAVAALFLEVGVFWWLIEQLLCCRVVEAVVLPTVWLAALFAGS